MAVFTTTPKNRLSWQASESNDQRFLLISDGFKLLVSDNYNLVISRRTPISWQTVNKSTHGI